MLYKVIVFLQLVMLGDGESDIPVFCGNTGKSTFPTKVSINKIQEVGIYRR